MANGTLLANRAELLQAPGCSCKLLKEVVVPEEVARCLLVSIQGNQHRVLLAHEEGNHYRIVSWPLAGLIGLWRFVVCGIWRYHFEFLDIKQG